MRGNTLYCSLDLFGKLRVPGNPWKVELRILQLSNRIERGLGQLTSGAVKRPYGVSFFGKNSKEIGGQSP